MAGLVEFKTVKAFFIFQKDEGHTLFTRSYETTSTAPDAHLVVAFLSAMFSFAKTSSLSELRVVDMTDIRFSFIEKDGLIFSVLVSPLVSPLDVQFKLSTLASLFFEEYGDKLPSIKLIDTEMFASYTSSFQHLTKCVHFPLVQWHFWN